MRNVCFLLFFIGLGFLSCQEIIEAPVPDLAWAEFDSPDAQPLAPAERKALEGVYAIGGNDDDFGKDAALKWSYVAAEKDTVYYLSFFCAEDVRYFICRVKKKGDTLLFNGYWRNAENTKTGKARFKARFGNDPALAINGTYGLFDDEPEKDLSFRYLRPLSAQTDYLLIAHRGGGRNNDLLPASENSTAMILLAAQLGANGIEIDVQLTRDGVPVLFHDANLNDRLTTKTGIQGSIDEYSWGELQKEVNLKRGGKIPSLEQALDTALYNTPLEFVWLDCKYETVIEKAAALQKKYTEKAKAAGRKFEIVIGVPDESILHRFLKLPDWQNTPSLCELDTARVTQMNAAFWAPSYTKGHQDEEVQAVQAKGKRALVWTVDVPDKIKEFMYETKFNGLVTNRPTMAAYYFYARR